MSTTSRSIRDHRWNLRVAAAEDEIVRAASESAETGFTSFVRDAAVSEAKRVLADRTTFELDEAAWQQFSDLLERPAKVPEGLRDLFSRPSVFE